MESPVDEKAVRDLAKEIAKNIKTEDDRNDFSKLLRKVTVETSP